MDKAQQRLDQAIEGCSNALILLNIIERMHRAIGENPTSEEVAKYFKLEGMPPSPK